MQIKCHWLPTSTLLVCAFDKVNDYAGNAKNHYDDNNRDNKRAWEEEKEREDGGRLEGKKREEIR